MRTLSEVVRGTRTSARSFLSLCIKSNDLDIFLAFREGIINLLRLSIRTYKKLGTKGNGKSACFFLPVYIKIMISILWFFRDFHRFASTFCGDLKLGEGTSHIPD